MNISKFYQKFADELVNTVYDPDGWLSDAQNARLNLVEDAFVEFTGHGSIDIYHIASIAYQVLEREEI